MSRYFQTNNSNSPYYNDSSSEETSSSDEENSEIEEPIYDYREHKEKINLFIKDNCLRRRIVHKKILNVWELCLNCWDLINKGINWTKIESNFCNIFKWLKVHRSDLKGSILPALIRLFLKVYDLIEEHKKKDFIKSKQDAKEFRSLRLLDKELNQFILKEKNIIIFFKKLKYPYNSKNTLIQLRIEDYLISSAFYVLDLSNLNLNSVPEEVYNLDIILSYYSTFDTLQNQSLYHANKIQFIDLGFNKFKNIIDPYMKFKKLSGLKGLFLDGSKTSTISASLIFINDLKIITGYKRNFEPGCKRNKVRFETSKFIANKCQPLPPTLFELALKATFENQIILDDNLLSKRISNFISMGAICEGCDRFILKKSNVFEGNYSSLFLLGFKYQDFYRLILNDNEFENSSNDYNNILWLNRSFCVFCLTNHHLRIYYNPNLKCSCITCLKQTKKTNKA